jgi:hypothetical protein
VVFAHDFYNLLTGVLGYASLIKNFLSMKKILYRYAEANRELGPESSKTRTAPSQLFERQRKSFRDCGPYKLLEDISLPYQRKLRDIEIEIGF